MCGLCPESCWGCADARKVSELSLTGKCLNLSDEVKLHIIAIYKEQIATYPPRESNTKLGASRASEALNLGLNTIQKRADRVTTSALAHLHP